jgi:hypothetical protein
MSWEVLGRLIENRDQAVVGVGLDGGEAYRLVCNRLERRNKGGGVVVLALGELESGEEEERVGLAVTVVGLISSCLERCLREVIYVCEMDVVQE